MEVDLTFKEAEFLQMFIKCAMKPLSRIEKPGMVDDLLAVNAFMGGEDEGPLTEDELNESREDVIDSLKDSMENMQSISSKIKNAFGI